MQIKVEFDAEAVLEGMKRSPETAINQLRLAINDSCRLIQRNARGQHRFTVRTGMLERAVKFRTALGDRSESLGVVYIAERIAPYGKYVHEGTRPHDITPKRKQCLRFIGKNGSFVFSKKIYHPGTKPDPFLYEASELCRAEINAIFARRVQEAVKEAGL